MNEWMNSRFSKPLLVFTFTLTGPLTLVLSNSISAQSTDTNAPSIDWRIPNQTSLECSNHTNCFTSIRTISVGFSDDVALRDVFVEINQGNGWEQVYSNSSLNGESSFDLFKQIDFSRTIPMYYGNEDVDMRARAIDESGNEGISATIPIKIDIKAPDIRVIKNNDTIIRFTNNPTQVLQAFSVNDVAQNGVAGSGLNKLKFQLYKDINSKQSWYPLSTGLLGSVENLPIAANSSPQDVIIGFYWSRALPDGYYWMDYYLLDNSIMSEDSNGLPTNFNQRYSICKTDNGSTCTHISGSIYGNEFYPIVVDTTAPNIDNIRINGDESFPLSDELSGELFLTLDVIDTLSWIKEVTIKREGKSDINMNIADRVLSGNANLTLGPNELENGINNLDFCATDYAGNERCYSTAVNINNEFPQPIITVSWTSAKSDLTVNFQGDVDANGAEISSYYWDFGDGNTSTELNPIHTYEYPGTYEVTFKAIPVIWEGNDYPSSTANVTVTESDIVQSSSTATTTTNTVSTTTSTNSTSITTTSNSSTSTTSSNSVNTTSISTSQQSTNNNTQNSSSSNNSNNTASGRVLSNGSDPGTVASVNDANRTGSDEFYLKTESPIITYVGDTVTFEVDTDAGLEFQHILWQFGDKKEEQTELLIVSHIYNAIGTYPLVITGLDFSGQQHTITATVIVKERPISADNGDNIPEAVEIQKATITVEGLLEFVRTYPWFCCIVLLLLLVLIWPFIRNKIKKEEDEDNDGSDSQDDLDSFPEEDLSGDEDRPLLSKRNTI